MPPGRATTPPGPASTYFHVLVRRSLLRYASAFNLNEADVLRQFVKPWQQGGRVLLDGRAWDPIECRLTIYEGPRLSTQQRSFGQGWSNALKFGENVTHEILSRRFESDEPKVRGKSTADHPLKTRSRLTLWGRLDRVPGWLATMADVITVGSVLIPIIAAGAKLMGAW
jgi:hypothetical protein